MATFGTINSYDPGTESWAQYTERLEQFFIANGIDEADRQRAIFLTVVGPSTYGLLKNLLSPVLPTARTLEQLIAVLDQHFDPAPSEIVERFRFNARVRKGGESISTFIAELRRLAKKCNYGQSLDTMLRDRIVCGIQDEAIQRKLLSENALTLARATEIALSMEMAAKNAGDLKVALVSDANFVQRKSMPNKAKVKRKPPPSTTPARAGVRCNRCGADNHRSQDCRFLRSTCNSCGKIGHIAKVCMSKSKGSRKENIHESRLGKVNQVIEPQTEEDYQQYELFNLRCDIGEAPPAAKVTCSVEGQDMTFELDSGASFSLIPLSVYKQNAAMPALQKANVRVQSYTKHSNRRSSERSSDLQREEQHFTSFSCERWVSQPGREKLDRQPRINIRLQGKTSSLITTQELTVHSELRLALC
ncbi:hypothetical protein JTE90_029485 [Oedothorax gibbosus]|uniref:CCHC-type domain-containing protein n=1 Tax=Oedothorax gibbosus TaxID=931172 RepID=A0AAV6V4M6_9ARAC|nr:hypothetical protein JTE90_029485 [Oedothorax gibbosus]